jgi:bifunctional DNA-binding transcriptional regulator/antitoxin component of YhaV-PrlF toxin-antitoxin module
MKKILPVSKRGTITLPPEFRRKLGLDRLESPLVLVEESEGKLVLEAATAQPLRDLPASTLRQWIAEDEDAARQLPPPEDGRQP